MNVIPCQPVASQAFRVTLAGQPCSIAVYQKSTGLFLDLSVNGVPLVQGVICRNRVLLVRQAYLQFIGDLAFVDTEGAEDPSYTGLGARWLLCYLSPSEAVV